MRNFRSYSTMLALIATGLLLSTSAAVQAQDAASKAPAKDSKKSAEKSNWTLPRTPDGQPDIQGYWTSLSFTPMEREAKYGNREFLTDKEMAEVFKAGVQHTYEFTFANSAETPVYDATVYALGAWQNGIQPNPRTSLVVDPPDGRIPPITPEAKKLRATMKRGASDADEGGDISADGPEDLAQGVRCLTFGGPPILPRAYDSNTHIVQGPGYVIIEGEWNSEYRVIPLDGGTHLASNMSEWHADARGHWEGNTLVVENTNFRPDATFQGANAKTLKITEYFTRTNEKTLEYKFTVSDPSTWTKPWTVIEPLSQVEGPMFEYACQEGNNAIVNILEGVRVKEKEQQKGQNKQKMQDNGPISQR